MSFEPSLDNDCLLIDGTETVILHGTSDVTVTGAKRGRLELSDVEFRQVGLEAADLAWTLPGVNLGDVEPAQGDAIEDSSGTFWTIQSAALSPLTNRWRALTRRQV
ncbi:MAG TPA: hypothetical protein VHV08_06330 [Pirellulales bacterium]|jgi:hypothetical protein|nr:hypothetical protein [Pirellulales bacterium]